MKSVDNNTGILLKTTSDSGELTTRYFLNKQGVLNYSDNESFIKDLVSNYSNNSEIPESKLKSQNINQEYLKDFFISSNINTYTEDNKFGFKDRLYFELFPTDYENEDNPNSPNTIKVFSYLDENIKNLYDCTKPFCKLEDTEEKMDDVDLEKNLNISLLKTISTKSMRDVKYMEEIITKLDGKFVNQDNWDK